MRFLIFLFPFALLQSNQLDFGKINVITTNDIHGMIGEQEAAFMNPNFPPTIIGGSAYYKYVRDLENQLPGRDKIILTLDGGNFFQGHPLGIVDSGKTMINWMNKIKYDAMVPGNTDFIYGYKNLVSLSKLAHFPFVASNIFYNNNDKHVFDPYTITTINGVKVGIIGVVPSDMNDIVLKKNIEGIYFTSEIDAVNKYSKELKEKNVDIVIGSRMKGWIESGAMSRRNWIGNHMLTWLAVFLHGTYVSDLCTGFWVLSRNSIEKMELNSIGFEIEAEMYAAAAHNGLVISEVPIHYDKRIGQSKLGSIADGFRIAMKVIRRRFVRKPIS